MVSQHALLTPSASCWAPAPAFLSLPLLSVQAVGAFPQYWGLDGCLHGRLLAFVISSGSPLQHGLSKTDFVVIRATLALHPRAPELQPL